MQITDVSKSSASESPSTSAPSGFSHLDLSPEILRALGELGIQSPTPIQAETLPILLGEDTDFIGLAATGTGKTAAFAIPLIERIDRISRIRRSHSIVRSACKVCGARDSAH